MTTDPTLPLPADILIVDDQPENLSVLMGVLQTRGYKVRPVTSGKLALAAAHVLAPDLILLDLNMPEMDGYQVCEELKRDPNLRAAPVIFISAFNEASDKVKGFALGGVDYVTKPFQIEEVEARVSTHLELARLRRQLELHNERLEGEVALRTRELVAANACLAVLDQAKSDFLSLLSHELRTPLCGIFSTTEIVLDKYAKEPGAVDYLELAEMYAINRKRLVTLIADAELLTEIGTRTGTNSESPCWLEQVVNHAQGHALPLADSRKVRLSLPPLGLGQVRGAFDSLVRAFQSLLETAVKFANPGTTVHLTKVVAPEEISLIITAEGRTIPAVALPNFFSLMKIANPIASGGDLDLAPALAERIVRLYGGTVVVENLNPPGIQMTVRLKTIRQFLTLDKLPTP